MLKGMIAGGALLSAGFLDAWYFERRRLVLKTHEVFLKGLPKDFDGARIAQLSDFHYDDPSDGELIRRAVTLANGLNPDLIALTGDFVTAHDSRARASARNILPCVEILSDLRAPLGIFAALGNHDACDPSLITRSLDKRGIAVLHNRAIYVERAGSRIWLAGVEDVLMGKPRLDLALSSVPEAGTTILLAHEPDYADVVRQFPVALQLSGHSHGGQVHLPPLDAPFLPELARKYPAGLYRLGELTLYTNSGLGSVILPLRFNSPPEVTLLKLRTAAS